MIIGPATRPGRGVDPENDGKDLTAYYLHNGSFHALLCAFVAAFLRWRADTRAGRGQQLAPGQFKKLQMIVRTEMALLLAPLFATWMAHGPLY